MAGEVNYTQVSEAWRLETQGDADANANAKTYTVPAGEEWIVQSIYVSYTSDATAGNRQLAVQVLDASDNVLADFRAAAVQAASLTRVYMFGAFHDTDFRDTDYLGVGMPPLVLSAGQKLKIFDKANNGNGISAADDMTVRAQVAARSV